MSKRWKIFFVLLVLATVTVWLSVFSTSSGGLKVISCNIGQGDASLIIYKNFEILIDGGPNNKVLDCLSTYMPFWDREIEVVMITHPQADHYTGIISVLDNYKVDKILANALNSSNQSYQLLKNKTLLMGIDVINPVRGTSIRSNLIQLDILYPTESFLAENYRQLTAGNDSGEVSSASSGSLGAFDSKLDPNEFSIISLLRFGSFKFLFTGDASVKILDDLATTMSESGDNSINYIKIPHHGSKSALSERFYGAIKIGVASISVGKNSYGHPRPEILDLLKKHNIQVFRTDELGDIVFETDGNSIWTDN